MYERLREVLDRLGRPRILILGDLMLDRYVYGDAERISQEAPIQVLRVAGEEDRVGGAGAVANNIVTLGGRAEVVSMVGRDAVGGRVLGLLRQLGCGVSGVRKTSGRPTTIKTRFIGRAQHRIPQQVLRVDLEETHPVDARTEAALAEALRKRLASTDVLVISDYAKGLVTRGLAQEAIRAARKLKVPVLIDPIRGNDYSHYRGATLLTPNRAETEMASGRKIVGEASLRAISREMIGRLRLEALTITLDKEGIFLAERGQGSGRLIPTRPRNVFDNAGAGDMVIAALAMALGSGASLEEASMLANVAGGLEVEKLGVQPVTREEIASDLMASSGKVRSVGRLVADLAVQRRNGRKIVFTNGTFDLLHHGHVQYLEFARTQGDLLVVGLNSDASVRRLKGAGRPLVPQGQRARVLAGLLAVDYVVIFDEETPASLIRRVRPDVLVKGEDWRDKGVVGADFVESIGGKVVLAPLSGDASTSNIIRDIRAAGPFAAPLTEKRAATTSPSRRAGAKGRTKR
jgi:D-beta-D-heptose 7-phosphate kinase/D-beta-D-heptose 1-phosphate adenosyltransferase